MSRTWFTSDLHLGHANILKFEPRRREVLGVEFIEEHDAALIARLNKQIRPEDRVYVLGDVGNPFLISKLNGEKHLILGNHDALSAAQYRRAGFVSVQNEVILKLGKTYFRLSHYPYRAGIFERLWRRLRGFMPARDNHKRPLNDGKWLLHGHIHSRGSRIPYKNQIHVGVDTWNYLPMSWEQVQGLIKGDESEGRKQGTKRDTGAKGKGRDTAAGG